MLNGCAARRRAGRQGFFTSGLPAQADKTDGRVVVVARHVGTPPFLTDFAFDLDRAGELVAERRRRSVALVLPRRADIVVEAVGEPRAADQPAPEGVVDLHAGVVR